MIVHSSFSVLLLCIVVMHTIYAINPEYLRQSYHGPEWSSLLKAMNKQLSDQHSNLASSEQNQNNNDDDDADDDQPVKRNKYPNFHLSPLWLSRRTRTNRFYGKPLWISRTG
ncbi:unnamed protein product [Rotaria socialis]|uniref:Uncharacterized protein n=1 Tax=Rotaria socialis TaxID=392032 RepID=A0A818X6Z9_9BILA|nr:unnamed protein product [Rotaria socialis]CAF3736327.1 unnamed protein product [Rotaria socialis]CAF3797251.1 unnamed protein product [Rotaria socialis]CAF4201906.1 unnamed protein product [Rotaria socialis]CAF4479107.1 unnamed protein product [Rotaria socialis]